jgi:hypothetical protein
MVNDSALLELTAALEHLNVPPPVNPKKVGKNVKSNARNKNQGSEEQSARLLSIRDSVERIGESCTWRPKQH